MVCFTGDLISTAKLWEILEGELSTRISYYANAPSEGYVNSSATILQKLINETEVPSEYHTHTYICQA